MKEIKSYYEQKLSEATIQKEIITKGTEILISSIVLEGSHVDLLKLENVLKVYNDIYDDIERDCEYYEKEIKLDNEIEKSIIEKGGEKNDSESV